ELHHLYPHAHGGPLTKMNGWHEFQRQVGECRPTRSLIHGRLQQAPLRANANPFRRVRHRPQATRWRLGTSRRYLTLGLTGVPRSAGIELGIGGTRSWKSFEAGIDTLVISAARDADFQIRNIGGSIEGYEFVAAIQPGTGETGIIASVRRTDALGGALLLFASIACLEDLDPRRIGGNAVV